MDEQKISDYALIGNSRSAALVGKNGSIDWCCLPEFDSPGIFSALLDSHKGGHFTIAPEGSFTSCQQYLLHTNVVETVFTCSEGKARLLDAFTAMTEEEKEHTLFPDHEILRIAEGVSGTVKLKLEYMPRTFYGQRVPLLKDYGKLGIHFVYREHVFVLLATLPPAQIKMADGGKAVAEFNIKAGERIIFSMSSSSQCPAVLPELRETGMERMQNTARFWKNWVARCTYEGPYTEQVKRSVLALKLLTHAPTGAIIAAPTSSLPESIGGGRNWDYRYCWLRDASFTTRVLVSLGYEDEVHAYMNWILHATQLTRPRLQVVYSVFGHTKLGEKILDWLAGYRQSRPVRTGNQANGQFQLDVYGEVLDAIYTYAALVKKFDRVTTKFIVGLGEVICKIWDQPDNGIWEIRSPGVHHTHSKVMAWAGLDRLVKLTEKYKWKNVPLQKFKDTASHILTKVEQSGYSNDLKSYTGELNGATLDASALTFPLVGYAASSSGRMASTTERIYESLSKNNLVYRYTQKDDGLKGKEGSFGICNFWLAENFARAGKLENAITVFEAMLKHASPAGLFSEEIDPESGELLGNYPQGFTHIGLINAAITIKEESNSTNSARDKTGTKS